MLRCVNATAVPIRSWTKTTPALTERLLDVIRELDALTETIKVSNAALTHPDVRWVPWSGRTMDEQEGIWWQS